MKRNLVGTLANYNGVCDSCGTPVKAEYLLVHDLGITDKDGNQLYLAFGVVDSPQSTFGEDLICSGCGHTKLVIRIYKTLDVTRELASLGVHQ